jgi:hypothetical protein
MEINALSFSDSLEEDFKRKILNAPQYRQYCNNLTNQRKIVLICKSKLIPQLCWGE